MLQAQATTRASANRRLALVPSLTGIGYGALTAIVLAWGVRDTDELGRTIDYVRDGTFAATLLLTVAAAAALRPALGISRRAFGLVALGELLVFVGVLVGLRRLIGDRPARSAGGMVTHLVDQQNDTEEEQK